MTERPMTTVLVTGGAGFIGSHLIERLLEGGHPVVALDDLSTGSLRNIQHLIGRRDFRFEQGSVLDRETVHRVMAEADVVMHLAAAVGVKMVVEHPMETIDRNVRGTENVLEAALRYGRKVFIASTSEVYGKEARPAARRVPGDRRHHARRVDALVVRVLQGARRVSGPRVSPEQGAARRHRALLQHRGSATERRLRDGHPALRGLGADRQAAAGVRRRRADPGLHARAGRGAARCGP